MLRTAQAKALDDMEDELKCSIWCDPKPLSPPPHRAPSYSLSRPALEPFVLLICLSLYML